MGEGAGVDTVPPAASADSDERSRFGRGAAWVSAGAAALSAIVAAIALLVSNAGSDDKTSTSTAPAATPGPSAPDATPIIGARRTIAIASMAFVPDERDGPVFEFRGTAELNDPDDEEIRVIARPVVENAAAGAAAEEGDIWLTSPAAAIDRDGAWLTRIKQPPLPEGSFDFAAVIAPTPKRTPVTQLGEKPKFATSLGVSQASQSACGAKPAIKDSGVKSCLVLDATVVGRYDP